MSNILNLKTLVLNSNFRPLSLYPLSVNNIKKILKLLLKDKLIVVEEYDDTINISGVTIFVPKVVVLKKYVQIDNKPKFSRHNVYLRDGYCCQYCGKMFNYKDLTFDHVIPKRLGGETSWINIVTACKECNHNKSGKTLEEAHLKPLHTPCEPSNRLLLTNLKQLSTMDMFKDQFNMMKQWNDYIGI